MPWNAHNFGSRHNHGLTEAQSGHAARIANAVLRRSGDEGMAIAVANKHFQGHAEGGGIVDPAGEEVDEWLHSDRGSPWKRADGGEVDDSPDMTDQYNTELTPEQEAAFQRTPDAHDVRDYDSRGAFLAKQNRDPSTGHGFDTWKKPNHPTFSTGSMYHGADGHQGGTWTPLDPENKHWSFAPSETNLRMRSPEQLQRYFQTRDRDSQLILPQQSRGGIVGYDDGGGIVDPAGEEVGGVAPTTETMNPLTRGMIQRYSSLPPEKLQELSVMMGGSPQGALIQRLLARKRTMPDTQTEQRAPGGMLSGSPPATREEERAGSTGFSGANGFLHGPTPGRADQIMTTAPAGSHVLPADVIAGMGQGNSLAGANVMTQLLRMGPGGIPMPSGGGRRTMPSPPPPPKQQSRGGRTAVHDQATAHEHRPVALSHGEMVVSPEDVKRWGLGDPEVGHRVLDYFITEARKKIIAEMRKLPNPVGMKK